MGKGVAQGEGGFSGFKIVPIFSNEGVKYLTKDYLKKLEDCIRQRTPIAGTGITIKTVDGNYNISIAGGVGGGKPFPLTVCSNGTPTVVTVLLAS